MSFMTPVDNADVCAKGDGQQGMMESKGGYPGHACPNGDASIKGVATIALTLDVCLALPYGTRLNSMYWERLLRSSGPSTLVLNCAH